ncbi:MAG: winged helix-turn-helix transcriptional regulator [Lachnospiraceae bacterium]|nr:winged helix-turn-helix transcriptional regulator [Lachnospiraceae bacterium]
MLEDRYVSKVAAFFKTLGDETRVKIIYALSMKELCVNDIVELLNMTQSAVSHQLRQMKSEGVVKARRSGKNIFYSLDDEHVVEILEKTVKHVKHKV